MKLLDFLFPRKCIFCRTLLTAEEEDLCTLCRIGSPWYLQGKSQELTLRFLDSFSAIWYYDGYVRNAILRYKFRRGLFLARPFGKYLAKIAAARYSNDYDVISWVPVSRRRKWKRGYDQSYLLARQMAKVFGMKPKSFLKKTRNNPAQSGLTGASRRENVKDAYTVNHPQEVCGKHILLVDDVVTTGSTADECARVLKAAGAASVKLIAVGAARKSQKGE